RGSRGSRRRGWFDGDRHRHAGPAHAPAAAARPTDQRDRDCEGGLGRARGGLIMRRAIQLLRGLAALVATVAVVVGVPAALVEFVRWPLPTSWPTLDELQRAASMGITEETVIKTLAVVVWLAWSQVAIGILAECIA